MEQLKRLRDFLEGGFITKEEYEYRKKQIIDAVTQTSLDYESANLMGKGFVRLGLVSITRLPHASTPISSLTHFFVCRCWNWTCTRWCVSSKTIQTTVRTHPSLLQATATRATTPTTAIAHTTTQTSLRKRHGRDGNCESSAAVGHRVFRRCERTRSTEHNRQYSVR